MLPPVDEAVFESNPDFAKLYRSLTSDALSPDGSTKNDPTAKQRNAVRSELEYVRLEETKKHILRHALRTATPPTSQPPKQLHRRTKSQLSRTSSQDASQLPPELVDLILLLPAFIDQAQTTSGADLELLLSTPPFSDLPALLPQFTPIISSHLTSQASTLARVINPSTNPSFIHRSIPQLLPSTQALLATLSERRSALTSSRLSTTSNLVAHLNQHTEALVLLLRALEAKHGPSAHSTALRASEANLEAQLWATSLSLLLWETRATIYPPESQVALKNYRRHLRDAQMQLENKMRTREQELGEYGVHVSIEEGGLGIGKADEARERTFREMARVWREMEGRLKEIRRDLKRLDRS
ncbi:hypothetical protein JX265_009356 [Neoarthrinium moseri]|uniref:Uncharacterized protein n=1 Tax=Neoarthrinium moseri TaxID=1658444 RepID=A0A9P9WGB0_9PEZI|nr:hypothetical protein JX265_009356 [Neoarthrinium moseri]